MKIKLLVLSLGFVSISGFASPWINSEETQLKHSIDLLVSYGVIKRPVNQYPLLWSGLVQDIAKVQNNKLTPEVQFALMHVKHALEQAKQTYRSSVKVHFDDQKELTDGFGERKAAQSGVQTYGKITGDFVSAKVQVNYSDDAIDGKQVNHYGSHLAVLFDNWSLSAEQINYWWGPANENALLLSNNAAPMKAIRLSRANSDYQGPSFLSFVGPWQFTAIAAKQRPLTKINSDGDFWGARISSMPLPGLELGFSTTASDFVFTRDEEVIEHTTQQRLTSLDVKYSTLIHTQAVAFYAEVAGDNDSGLLPQKASYTFGIESFISSFDYRAKGYIELSDSTVDCHAQQASFQCNFKVAQQGADYYQRDQWLGAAIGPQAKSLTIAANYYRLAGFGGFAKFKLQDFESINVERTLLELGYQQGLLNGLGKVGLSIWQDKSQTDDETFSAVNASWEIQF